MIKFCESELSKLPKSPKSNSLVIFLWKTDHNDSYSVEHILKKKTESLIGKFQMKDVPWVTLAGHQLLAMYQIQCIIRKPICPMSH